MFFPFCAFKKGDIEREIESAHDDGEARLFRLRTLLIEATKHTAGLVDLLVRDAPSGLGEMLAGGDQDRRNKVLHGLMATRSETAPRCFLAGSELQVLTPAQADEMRPLQRESCIPLRYSENVAFNDATIERPVPCCVAVWSLGGGREAELRVERLSDTSARLTVTGIGGHAQANLVANDLPQDVVEALFRPTEGPRAPATEPSPKLLPPRSADEVPAALQHQIGAMLQDRFRIHALVSAAAPKGASRPLAFESMRVVSLRSTRPGDPPRMAVNAYLHGSSASCICAAHGFPRFTGKASTCITIQLCGRALVAGYCTLHGENTMTNPAAPGVCCCNGRVALSCDHDVAGKRVQGLFLRFSHMSTPMWREATAVAAAAIRFNEKACPLLVAKGAPPDARAQLGKLVSSSARQLARSMERCRRGDKAEAPNHAELVKFDVHVVQLLREGVATWANFRTGCDWFRLARSDRALNAAERRVGAHAAWLFPRSDSPRPPTPTHTPTPGQGRAKKQKLQPTPTPSPSPSPEHGYVHDEIVEFIDVEGVADLRRQLVQLLQTQLPRPQRERGLLFHRILDSLGVETGEEMDGPLGHRVLPLVCKYRGRHGGGRFYPHSMAKVHDAKKGEARTVCIQSAPREMRAFICGRFGHDYDLRNAQPELLRQMAAQLNWDAGDGEAPSMPQLDAWCADRDEFVTHVADVHCLPTDAERWVDFRKDLIKELTIRLIFGGTYDAWMRDKLQRNPRREPRSPRVDALAQELLALRAAVFKSREWREFYAADARRLAKAGGKADADAIDRACFARIAQTTENNVLTAMRGFLAAHGWKVLTLCFDGLIVQHDPSRTLDLGDLDAHVLAKTGFKLNVVEKPLFLEPTLGAFPTLSLHRAS